MITRMKSGWAIVVVAVVAAVLLAGCTSQPPNPAPSPSGQALSPVPNVQVDWSNRPTEPIQLAGDITAVGCEGEAPMLCVHDSQGLMGTVELLTFPADTGTDLSRVISHDNESFVEDRSLGCPDGYSTSLEDIEPVPVAGGDGMRSGYEVLNDQNEVVERYVKYWRLIDSTVYLIAAEAHADGSCVGGAENYFSLAGLEQAERSLAAIAEGSVLPS